LAAVCERWIAQAGIREDLFVCTDLIAVKVGEPILAVQETSVDNVSARLAKARALPGLKAWLPAGAKFEVWNGRWHVRRVVVVAEDLAGVEV
jgi:hypothetical protein